MARPLYDVLARAPALDKENMIVELEALAEKLMRSGRLRVDAGERINFVRFSIPQENIYRVFSWRELNDPQLQPQTMTAIRYELARNHRGNALEQKAAGEMARLRAEIARHLEVEPEMEMKLARAIVQAAHPSVILLLLWEEAEVFISFSYNIGDVLDIESWQKMGANSGMQSTAGRRHYAIYVSAGGSPFLPEDYQGHGRHGKPALARMMIIAAQEIGHFADILRNPMGQPVARHSANISVTEPTPNAREGRRKDMEQCRKVEEMLERCGLRKAMEAEKTAAYYAKHRKGEAIHKSAERKAKKLWKRFTRKAARRKLTFVAKFPAFEDPAIKMTAMVGDMLFNLSPVADVYRSDDPVQEEAIACAEALARVPQQVVKWGHHTVFFMAPHLYHLYYGQVIPACVQAYESITGQKYRFSYTIKRKPWAARRVDALTAWVRRRLPGKKT